MWPRNEDIAAALTNGVFRLCRVTLARLSRCRNLISLLVRLFSLGQQCILLKPHVFAKWQRTILSLRVSLYRYPWPEPKKKKCKAASKKDQTDETLIKHRRKFCSEDQADPELFFFNFFFFNTTRVCRLRRLDRPPWLTSCRPALDAPSSATPLPHFTQATASGLFNECRKARWRNNNPVYVSFLTCTMSEESVSL